MDPQGFSIFVFLAAIFNILFGVNDPGPLTEMPPPQPGGTAIELRVAGEIHVIPADQISSVQPVFNDQIGLPQVNLSFDSIGAARFGQITAGHLGQAMDLVVCDQVLMSPVIQEAITGGEILISGNFTVEEVTQIAQRITGQIPCGNAGR